MRGPSDAASAAPLARAAFAVPSRAVIDARDEVRALPFFRRFHVKTTLLFGVPVMALLAVLAVWSYRSAADAELAVLRARLRGLAIGLARTLDVDTVVSLERAEQHGSPAHRRLTDRFARIAELEPEVESIYVVRRTERERWVRFAADWVRSGTPARVGQLYDAMQTDRMLEAFTRPTVETRIYDDEWGRSLSGYAPIRDAAGQVVAVVGLDMRAERVEEAERRALVTTGLMFGVAVVLFALVGTLLGTSVRRPIRRIIEAAGAIETGERGQRIALARTDEFGLLAEHIDRMAEALEERERMRVLFGRYVSEDVARRVLASGDAAGAHSARERVVTVLFADLRRYSTISETLSPHEVLELLNAYFSAMTDVIDAHGGCVIELLGDGILAVFGAPEEVENHAERAVRCALEMRARLLSLNAEWEASGRAALWKRRGIERIGSRVGIHTGRVVVGTLGGGRRAKYAVLGHAVNVAMRLEAHNERLGTTILFSGDVLEALPSDLAARAEPRGSEASLAAYSL